MARHSIDYTTRRLEHDELAVLSALEVGPETGMVPYILQKKAVRLGGPHDLDPTSNEPTKQVCEILDKALDAGIVRADNLGSGSMTFWVWSLTEEGFVALTQEQDRRSKDYVDPEFLVQAAGLIHPKFGRIVFRAYPATLHTLSLGAGVQSTALALMVAEGVITRPDCAIFSDTGWEPQAVYDHLDWLESVVPFEVHRVSNGNILEDMLNSALTDQRWAGPPLFTKDAHGKKGKLRRLCTREYKLEPIMRKVKELIGLQHGQHMGSRKIEQWLGISTDEFTRAKPAAEQWVRLRWPLLELDMDRQDCKNWMNEVGYPTPPRSSCIGCPYHSDSEWARMRRDRPQEFEDACRVDEIVRDGVRGTTDELYTHSSLQPLRNVLLKEDENYDPTDTPDCGCAEEISDIWEV